MVVGFGQALAKECFEEVAQVEYLQLAEFEK